MNQSGSTTIELTDNNTNTWRDVINNLESTATDKSLSAAQGKILNESKLMHKTINTSKTDFNSLTETGIYHITITDALNAPVSNHGTLYVDAIVGTKYQEKTIHHDAVVETVAKDVPVELITAILEKPSFEEELDVVKSTVGIVNTNNMTLDEFKTYYKGVIGKACTAAIEGGVDVDTSFGKQHFSYTIEDQSNIKDLIITGIISDYALPLPYHADGHLCDTYQPEDILKIYMALSSNKTYHTTYCNILNAMIAEAKDMDSVKAITYGMEITDEKYTDVISKINGSKDALLKVVEEKVKAMASK